MTILYFEPMLDDMFPHLIDAGGTPVDHAMMTNWCSENIGKGASNLNGTHVNLHFNEEVRWTRWRNHFLFRQSTDALLFKLRWVNG